MSKIVQTMDFHKGKILFVNDRMEHTVFCFTLIISSSGNVWSSSKPVFLPFRAFCVQGPQNLMFVRPCVRVSVRPSVCPSRSPDLRLFDQLERRNCRGNEKKREKSSENEETVEKSREKWFGNGSVPNPSDYHNLT